MLRALFVICLAGWFAVSAAAEERFALVIGNQDYPAVVGPLTLPYTDAARIDSALQQAGFPAANITVLHDATQMEINLAVADLATRLRRAGEDSVGFFYYSGHGGSAEANGERQNYLIPAKTPVTGAEQLPILGVPVSGIVDSLAAAQAKAVFIVADACRNTLPLTSSKGGEDDKGMTRMPKRSGLYIAFATADGATTPDDGGFSAALASQIVTPGQTADRAFTLALRQVSRTRPGNKLPFSVDGLNSDICFMSCAALPVAPVAAATQAVPQTDTAISQEEADWLRLSKIGNAQAMATYAALYPSGAHVSDARALALELADRPAVTAREAKKALKDGNGALDREAFGKAADRLRTACDGGESEGCRMLGYMYQDGKGVDASAVVARVLFQRSCDMGNSTGCYWLAPMLREGLGGPQDEAAARAMYSGLCDNSPYGSCGALAWMMQAGKGGPVDFEGAVARYRLACDANEWWACSNLGQMVKAGQGTPPDAAAAVELFRRACDGGLSSGCGNLGYAIFTGDGVPADQGAGQDLIRKACAGGMDWSCTWLDQRQIPRTVP